MEFLKEEALLYIKFLPSRSDIRILSPKHWVKRAYCFVGYIKVNMKKMLQEATILALDWSPMG